MKIKDIMKSKVKLIQPDTTLKEAAEYMKELDCGYLPVGQNDRIIGAITDRDIIIRGIAPGHSPSDAMVKDIMTEKVHYCFEDDDVKVAAERMKTKQVRRLIVLNKEKRMTGVVSLGDIACQCNDNHLTGEIMKCCAKKAA
jgi:CBS domain-containing protein